MQCPPKWKKKKFKQQYVIIRKLLIIWEGFI